MLASRLEMADMSPLQEYSTFRYGGLHDCPHQAAVMVVKGQPGQCESGSEFLQRFSHGLVSCSGFFARIVSNGQLLVRHGFEMVRFSASCCLWCRVAETQHCYDATLI
jgi:hypothetical protein